MKRLLVLGAGLFQLPGITRAVELGFEVVTVDNMPDNVGHRRSHRSVELSTTDVEGVVALAKDLKADGVVTYSSDVAVEAVAAASTALGRAGPRRDVVRTLSHKGRFRELQHRHGLPHPTFRVVRSGGTLPPLGVFGDHDAVVVKPADTSGSRGVTVLRAPTHGTLATAADEARRWSRSDTVVVEGFLPGVEVGGDAFLLDGRVQRLCITDKRLEGVVVRGHRYPNTGLSTEQVAAVRSTVEDCCRAAGLRNGPLNLDVMVDGTAAVIIEMSPRTGGNGIPRIVAAVDGVDFEEAAARVALGEDPDLRRSMPDGVHAALSHVLDATGPGRVTNVPDRADLLALDPRITEAWLAVAPGEVLDGSRAVPKGLLVAELATGDTEPDLPTTDAWLGLAP